MVVNDLDIEGLSVSPLEADAKLVVHADTPLSGAVTRKCLEPVAWRNAKILYPRGGINHPQLALTNVGETRETRRNNTVEESLRVGIFESRYHIGGGYGITSGYHRQAARIEKGGAHSPNSTTPSLTHSLTPSLTHFPMPQVPANHQ